MPINSGQKYKYIVTHDTCTVNQLTKPERPRVITVTSDTTPQIKNIKRSKKLSFKPQQTDVRAIKPRIPVIPIKISKRPSPQSWFKSATKPVSALKMAVNTKIRLGVQPKIVLKPIKSSLLNTACT